MNTLSKITKKIQLSTNANDIFYTPTSLVEVHLQLLKPFVSDGDKIFDGFYGKGAYYSQFSKFFPTCTYDFTEIEMGKDFFEYRDPIDIIVSNPPYSKMDEVLIHSISLNPKIISYLISQHNLTTKRIEQMNKSGYYLVGLHLTKVFKWFGMSLIVIFSREATKNCVSFDRIIHR